MTRRCEVTLTRPPRGRAGALWESFGFGAGGGLTGAMAGALLAKKAILVALFGLPTALPLLAGGAALGALGNRLLYQYAIRQSREECARRSMRFGLRVHAGADVRRSFGDPAKPPATRWARRAPAAPIARFRHGQCA
ncbi:MAG: hypothetical protein IPN47_19790 [Gemmatimonadetes bacterium]|nr:hypothetical protein [Gemmatimonadota bacterium]